MSHYIKYYNWGRDDKFLGMPTLLQVIWHLPDYTSGKKMSLSRPVLKCLKHFHFPNDLVAFLFTEHNTSVVVLSSHCPCAG